MANLLHGGLDVVVTAQKNRCETAANFLSVTEGLFACCLRHSCEIIRSSKHEEAAKE